MNRKRPLLPVIIGTGFGTGFMPIAPGTAGAVLGVAVWWGLSYLFEGIGLVGITTLLIVAFTFLGTWATARLQSYWGEDPNRVVVDEMVGVWIPLLSIPLTDRQWWWFVLALGLFRFFDIVKPWGIRRLDRRKGAFWVMADDLLAGFYSLLILYVIIFVYEL